MAFQAYASKHGSVVKDTAYTAAVAFFEAFPKARKCNVIEGKDDGFFFTVEYKPNNPPKSFRDVTRKTLCTLLACESSSTTV